MEKLKRKCVMRVVAQNGIKPPPPAFSGQSSAIHKAFPSNNLTRDVPSF